MPIGKIERKKFSLGVLTNVGYGAIINTKLIIYNIIKQKEKDIWN